MDFAFPTYVVRELIWLFEHGVYLIIAKFDLFPSFRTSSNKGNHKFESQWFMFEAMNLDHLWTFPFFCAISAGSVVAFPSISLNWNALPSVSIVFQQMAVSRIIREMLRYWIHRLFHTRYLYRWVHKKHHEYTSTFSLVNEYADPVDNLVHGILPFLIGVWFVAFCWTIHVVTIWADLVLMTIISVEEHTGYMLPWNADYWPGLNLISGGSVHHGLHHQETHGNYGEYWVDRLFGTDVKTLRLKRGYTQNPLSQ